MRRASERKRERVRKEERGTDSEIDGHKHTDSRVCVLGYYKLLSGSGLRDSDWSESTDLVKRHHPKGVTQEFWETWVLGTMNQFERSTVSWNTGARLKCLGGTFWELYNLYRIRHLAFSSIG